MKFETEVREGEGMLPFKQFPEFGTVEGSPVPMRRRGCSASYEFMQERERYFFMDQSAKMEELKEKIRELNEWKESVEVSPPAEEVEEIDE